MASYVFSIRPRIGNELNISNTLRGNPGAPYRHNPKKVEPLVRKHLARARKSNSDAQSYGGSTGGRKSLQSGGSGLNVLRERATKMRTDEEIFNDSAAELGHDMRKEFSPKSSGFETFDL